MFYTYGDVFVLVYWILKGADGGSVPVDVEVVVGRHGQGWGPSQWSHMSRRIEIQVFGSLVRRFNYSRIRE